MSAGVSTPALIIDTNVLVYWTVAESPWHSVAVQTLRAHQQAGTSLWISRQIIREYISTILRIQVPARPVPAPDVAAAVRFFTARFRVADDTVAVTQRLLRLIEHVPMGGRLVHDANIVATMQAYGIANLLTHNVADFARFDHLVTVIPLV